MTLDSMYKAAKAGDLTADRKYQVGEISQKTGLQKQGDGSWAPPKNGGAKKPTVSETEEPKSVIPFLKIDGYKPVKAEVKKKEDGTLYEEQTYKNESGKTVVWRKEIKQEKSPKIDSEDVANKLGDAADRLWDKLGIDNGGQLRKDGRKLKEFAAGVKKELDGKGIKELPREVYKSFEESNNHTLNTVLGLMGYYGKEQQKKDMDFISGDQYNQYDKNAALEIAKGTTGDAAPRLTADTKIRVRR